MWLQVNLLQKQCLKSRHQNQCQKSEDTSFYIVKADHVSPSLLSALYYDPMPGIGETTVAIGGGIIEIGEGGQGT